MNSRAATHRRAASRLETMRDARDNLRKRAIRSDLEKCEEKRAETTGISPVVARRKSRPAVRGTAASACSRTRESSENHNALVFPFLNPPCGPFCATVILCISSISTSIRSPPKSCSHKPEAQAKGWLVVRYSFACASGWYARFGAKPRWLSAARVAEGARSNANSALRHLPESTGRVANEIRRRRCAQSPANGCDSFRVVYVE